MCRRRVLLVCVIRRTSCCYRQYCNIKGISTFNTECRSVLYADDVLLFLQDLYSPLPQSFKFIDSFSEVSSYSINCSRSTILPLCLNEGVVADVVIFRQETLNIYALIVELYSAA